MKVIKTSDIETEDITTNTLEGKATRQSIIGKTGEGFTVSAVSFIKGTARAYDSHSFDQVLYITEGKGLIKTETEEVTVTPGTFVFIPAGEKHSHNATKDSGFSQVTIGISH
ncbi:cupin domain-containing protein [Chloroflexota bacterium]